MPILQGVKGNPVPIVQDGIRVTGDEPAPQEEETSSAKPIIGIIYPPPEVRNIVDKTASFVARNGPEFETRIRQNEINNAKFNFLNSNDPYHAYYRHKVKEFLEGKGQEPVAPKGNAQTTKPSVAAAQEQFIPKEPPTPFEFIAEPPSIAAFDLDVVRLTAQFVARNGRSFLTQLMQREAKNYQFDFLRPQHSLFQYFTKLVEQFTKVLIPPKNLMAKLKIESEDSKKILDDVKYRVEWSKHEERLHAREKEELEREHQAYAQIDWHDFVVVETVDFHPDERGNFPAPVSMHEIGARILQQERYERYGEDAIEKPTPVAQENKEDDESDEEREDAVPEKTPETIQEHANTTEMDMEESDSEDESAPEPNRATMMVQSEGNMIIRKDYNPKQKNPAQGGKQGGEKMVISALTGEKIPASKLQEHMRVALLDPNWKEIRKRQISDRQNEEEVFAAGNDIEAALRGIAERRTDIFGVEETAIGKKVGEEEVGGEEKIVWDGHASSMESTRRQAQANTTVEEQIEAIHKAQGLLTSDEDKIGPSVGSASQPNIQSAPPQTTISVPPVQNQQILTPVVQLRPVINVPVQQPQQLLVVRQQAMGVQPVIQPPQQHVVRVATPVHTQLMMPQAPVMQAPTHQMPMHMQQDEGPATKRQRTEGNLIPEQDFLAMHNRGPVTFRIMCPNAPDKSDWKLFGQTMTFTLPLTDEVSVIKAKIHESTNMPAGKQKLQMDGIFLKDSNNLAYYNIASGAVIQLQVKERGGRKK